MSRRMQSGGFVDRATPVAFRFDGRSYEGLAGDTLASALLANDIRLVGRSFKYHRPRGIMTAGAEEPNALVELRTGDRREPNTRATTIELYSGLEASSQNRWPSLRWDLRSLNSLAAPLLIGGFYYKTFMWPASFWEALYEPAIRRAAGLGRASGTADPDSYERMHSFCDVLVIGAGPAGLAAACAAARAGARVILCDDDFRLGGRLLSEQAEISGAPAAEWVARAAAQLATLSSVKVLRRTTVFGIYDGHVYGAIERVSDHLPQPLPHQPRQRFWKIRAKTTIVATGAIESPMVFRGNDRPGVMTAAATRTYLRRFAVRPGSRAAIFTRTDDGWRTLEDLRAGGVHVEAIVDTRQSVHPSLLGAAGRAGVRTILDAEVTDTWGGRSLRGITARERTGAAARLNVDLLAVSGGWSPQVALTTHLGSKPRWSADINSFVPGELPHGMVAAGAASGSFSLRQCLAEGISAGRRAAEDAGHRQGSCDPIPSASNELTGIGAHSYANARRGKAFVDFQNDVTAKDIAIAVQEGFSAVEHVKRYTTLGMGTDQGKTSNTNGNALTAELIDRSMAETGSTKSRPPFTPVAIGALASDHSGTAFKPIRYTSGHDWAAECGAVFMDVGNWRRAQYFPLPGETSLAQSVAREVQTVRTAVGVCDVSTLGKIDIQGADAAAFLDAVYTSQFSTLPVGRTRYGFMLREDGLVMDDGTSTRMGPRRYLMSTTTFNAAAVSQHLDYCHQVLWPNLDVQITPVTESWAQYSIAGPRARAALQALFADSFDLSNGAFPYMAAAEFRWGAIPVRIFRLSFSGELAYELAVPATFGDAAIRAIMAAGQPHGIAPYGLEALSIMALEKGHVTGAEMNGRTTLRDLGFARLASQKKDFIGNTLSQRAALADPNRPSLVGLRSAARDRAFNAGSLLLSASSPDAEEGYVTSAGFSPTLQAWIGLGLLRRGTARIGETIRAFDPVRKGDKQIVVCDSHFYDPQGERLRV
jgi:sarcosine oxidase subunit alpha